MTRCGSARLIRTTLMGTRLLRPEAPAVAFLLKLRRSSTRPPEVTPEEFTKALPMSVVRKRIDRLMKPKADGTYKVPLELVEEWKKGDQMNILREFREAGLDKDRPTSAGHKMSDHKQFCDLKLLGTCLTEPTAHCRTSLFESLSSGSKRRCLKTTCGSMASLCQKRTCEMMVLKSNPAARDPSKLLPSH